MGGICSKGLRDEQISVIQTEILKNSSAKLTLMKGEDKPVEDLEPLPFSEEDPRKYDSGELELTSKSGELKALKSARSSTGKVPEIGSFLGRAGIAGLDRAVDVLDTVGSSMSNLNPGSGFVSGMATRGKKILILAFEVANTIAKGATLMQSLSDENIKLLKEEVLCSEGVTHLVSKDMEELLDIAAADKREDLQIFSREVVRFGDRCKDPQWHNLGRLFQKLDSDHIPQKLLKDEAEAAMQELTNLAQQTSELYHELQTLDRLEQDYRCKFQEEAALNVGRRGENVTILHSELKQQRKVVRSLRKKSLWSKNLETVVEKLVDIVTFLHLKIIEAFGKNGASLSYKGFNRPQRLGVSGLALHYANIVNQIENIVARPSSVPPNIRATLYNGLPIGVKAALRSNLQMLDSKAELTVCQIKEEMEKTLQWIVPLASNTTKAHQGFGWVGEWANNGNEIQKKTMKQNNPIRLQTLYHANREKADRYILDLVTWLHYLVKQVKYRDGGILSYAPVHSLAPGGSTSQGLNFIKMKSNGHVGLSRSFGNSPTRQFLALTELDEERTNVSDVLRTS